MRRQNGSDIFFLIKFRLCGLSWSLYLLPRSRRYTAVMETRKQRGPIGWLAARSWRFWIAAAIGLPTLYALSLGPACWLVTPVLMDHEGGPIELGPFADPLPVAQAPFIYWPIGWAAERDTEFRKIIRWYAYLGRSSVEVCVPTQANGKNGICL
jgi:hypothetical protein